MLRQPSRVERKAKPVGTQVLKSAENLVRKELVGVQCSGRLGEYMARSPLFVLNNYASIFLLRIDSLKLPLHPLGC